MNNKQSLLGAHISISGGFEKSIERGSSIGCSVIQIFTHSNRQWKFKKIKEEEFSKFKKAKKNSQIESVIAHSSYLINLGSSSKEVLEKSIETLEKELILCDELEIKYLVLHPGSGQESKKKCLIQIANSINKIFNKDKTRTVILFENTSGQGSSVGSQFEELSYLYALIENKNRIGICFDTCHAWAAGYDFSNKEKYEKMWQKFDQILGLNLLKAFHLNDSKKNLNSKIDRHEELGKGTIGLEVFRLIVNDKKFENIPKILETPDKELLNHKINLELLKNLIDKK